MMLQAISAMKPEQFFDVQAPKRELEADDWNLEGFQEHAVAAQRIDSRLARMVYAMVPKQTSESEFWRLYFCHVCRSVCSDVDSKATNTESSQVGQEEAE